MYWDVKTIHLALLNDAFPAAVDLFQRSPLSRWNFPLSRRSFLASPCKRSTHFNTDAMLSSDKPNTGIPQLKWSWALEREQTLSSSMNAIICVYLWSDNWLGKRCLYIHWQWMLARKSWTPVLTLQLRNKKPRSKNGKSDSTLRRYRKNETRGPGKNTFKSSHFPIFTTQVFGNWKIKHLEAFFWIIVLFFRQICANLNGKKR